MPHSMQNLAVSTINLLPHSWQNLESFPGLVDRFVCLKLAEIFDSISCPDTFIGGKQVSEPPTVERLVVWHFFLIVLSPFSSCLFLNNIISGFAAVYGLVFNKARPGVRVATVEKLCLDRKKYYKDIYLKRLYNL